MAENTLNYPAKLKSNNPNSYGIVDAVEVSGFRQVAKITDLYTLKTPILSQSLTGEDAIGQDWFVQEDKHYYRLKDWTKRGTAEGWEKQNGIGDNTDFDGPVNFNGITKVLNSTDSSDSSNGAFVVIGGVGVGKRLNVGSYITANNGFVSPYVSGSYINAIKKSALHLTGSGFVGVFDSPTKSGRVTLASYSSDDILYFGFETNTEISAGTNAFSKVLKWDIVNQNLISSKFTGALVGNASTATKLQTPRTINGTNFDGSANITTVKWGTERTITLSGDSTGSVSIDGSTNVTINVSNNFLTPKNSNNADLNTLLTKNGHKGDLYYGSGSNTSSNKPSGVDWFSLLNMKAAGGNYTTQILGSNSKLYFRSMDDSNPTGWYTIARTIDNVASATKLQTPRALSIASSDGTGAGATVNFDGTTNAVIKLPATIKASLSGNASTATKLQTPRTINGTNFDGSANITTANWGTARNITIASSDGTGASSAVSVNGGANVTLKLPSTIKASLTGNASSASKLLKGTNITNLDTYVPTTSVGQILTFDCPSNVTGRPDLGGTKLGGIIFTPYTDYHKIIVFPAAADSNAILAVKEIDAKTANTKWRYVATGASNGNALVANSAPWSGITGKPSSFTPSSHTHPISQISDLNASWDSLLKNAPSGYVTRWPSISEVTAKQNLIIKLNGGTTENTNQFTYNATGAKTINITPASIGAATSGHAHTWDQITGKPSSFTPSTHTHAISQISDLNASWDSLLKNAPSGYVTRWPAWSEVTGKPSSFTPSTHSHNSLDCNELSGTVNLNTLNLSSGSPEKALYICKTDGGGASITGRPDDNNKTAFILIVELIRWSSNSDYISKQTYIRGREKIVWSRYCTNGSWSSWEKTYTSAHKPTLTELGAAATSHTHSWSQISGAPAQATRWPSINEVTAKQNLIIKLNDGTTENTNQFTYNATGAKTINITPASIGAAASRHSHTWDQISNKPSSFTPTTHTHTISQISDLNASWDALLKAAPSGYVTRWPAWSEVTGKPSSFTPSSHTHDDRYYTESEINSKLAGYSPTNHTHSNYASSSHNHDGVYIKGNTTSSQTTQNVTITGAFTAKTFYKSSDKRLKSDIRDIDASIIEAISSIKAKSFKLYDSVKKEDKGLESIGYIAQEVENKKALKKFVYEVDGIKKLDYEGLLVAKIAYLEKENSLLKERLEKIEKILSL